MFAVNSSLPVIRFFSGNNPLNVLMLFFVGILLRLPFFLNPVVPVSTEADGFLYHILLKWLAPAGTFFPPLYPILSYLLLFLQAVTFNGLINRQRLYPQPNLLLGFAFLLLTGLIPEWNQFSPGLLINTVMVWAWPQMIGLYQNQKPAGNLFNLGVAFGICTFIYFPAIYYLLLLYMALAIFRTFRLTEWLITLVGVVMPFYFLLVYFFVWDQWNIANAMLPNPDFFIPRLPLPAAVWMAVFLVFIPLLLGLLLSRRLVIRMLVHARKSWNFMTVYLILALLLPFVSGSNWLSHFVLALVPISFFHTGFYLAPRSKFVPELTIWISIAWIVLNNFFLQK
jgi:hypothetical protein